MAKARIWIVVISLSILLSAGCAALKPEPAAVPATPEVARRGCCSHHDGVCGCNAVTGYQLCCDGTDSPSCKCGE